MQKARHKFFRWTPRTARITVMYVAVIPTIMGIIAYKTDVSYLAKDCRERSTLTTYRDYGTSEESEGEISSLSDKSSSGCGGVGLVCTYIGFTLG